MFFIIFLYFIVPRDCADVYKSGRHRNGIYTIDPDGEEAIEVYCDQVGQRKALLSFRLWPLANA